MANTKNTIKTTKKETESKAVAEIKVETEGIKAESPDLAYKYKVAAKNRIPDEAQVPVTSIYEGELSYDSPITLGYHAQWNEFGDTVDIEFKELKAMMRSQIRFYSEPWISIPKDVIVALRAERFYKDTALTVEEFNALFTKAPNEITATIAPLSASFKKAIRTKAKRMIEDREIDSIAIKEAIEAGLGSPLFDDYN